MTTQEIILILQVILLAATTWTAYKGTRSRIGLDFSQTGETNTQTELNFQKLYVSMKMELKELNDKYKVVKELLDRSHLEVSLSIELGEEPVVISHRWIRSEDAQNIMATK